MILSQMVSSSADLHIIGSGPKQGELCVQIQIRADFSDLLTQFFRHWR